MKNIFLFPSVWNQSLNILIKIFNDIPILQIKFYHFFLKAFCKLLNLEHICTLQKNVTHSTLQGFRVLSSEHEYEFGTVDS